MKIVNAIFGLLFLLFAGWQYNDPDPVIWISIYSITALICIGSIWKKFPQIVLLTTVLLFAIYLIILIPGVLDWWNSGEQDTILQGMDRRKPFLEETREFFGLIIAIGAIKANWIYNWKGRS